MCALSHRTSPDEARALRITAALSFRLPAVAGASEDGEESHPLSRRHPGHDRLIYRAGVRALAPLGMTTRCNVLKLPVMTKRLFVAIDLPDSIKATLRELDPKLRGVKWVSSKQMHLTLGFFGSVPPSTLEDLKERLSAIHFGSFFLPVQGFGAFPAKGSPNIIWIGVGKGHPHLFQIHKRVQEAALASGLQPDLRPWHPHITLARCRDVSRQAVRKLLEDNTENE